MVYICKPEKIRYMYLPNERLFLYYDHEKTKHYLVKTII